MLVEMMVSLSRVIFRASFFQKECGWGLLRFVVQGFRFSCTRWTGKNGYFFSYIPGILVYGNRRIFSIEIL